MAAHGESNKIIIIALMANVGIAIAKFTGAFFTKSASLLAEAIHSLADCTNQIFLLIGAKAAAKPADDLHPLGYGRESFFWSFMVAMLLFSMGGMFAIYEGIHKLSGPESELQNPYIALGILIVSILLEGGSFFACLKVVRKQNIYPNLWQWFQKTAASDLIVIFMEDLAALLGLCLASIFLMIAIVTNNVMWDAAGSIVIGVLLVIVAVLLAREVKSLLVGEKSTTDYTTFINQELKQLSSKAKVLKLITLMTGSHEVMLTMKIHPGDIEKTSDLITKINELEKKIKKQFPEIRWLFVEPDTEA
ncbi:MAG: cation diffusion facilitator family transporter [Bdellovibrio sp.]|nr:cation diffusion facilitator family transporter [Bdellovibrio sp.]